MTRHRSTLSIFLALAIFALTAIGLSGCSPQKTWKFATDRFAIAINDQGQIISMRDITSPDQREFSPADKPSPLMCLHSSTSGEYTYPTGASYNAGSNVLTLKYPGGAKAKVSIALKERYIRLTLNSLRHPGDNDAIQWGPIHTNITNLLGEIIGVARDTSEAVNYSIGMLALDDNTLGVTADIEGDAAPFQYIIHTPDAQRFPLPDNIHEGQVFTLGGDGISDIAFYANKEPYYRIMYGNAAMVDDKGQISINYMSRDRTKPRTVTFTLMPTMSAHTPSHIDLEQVPGVDYIGSSVALWGSPDTTALLEVIQRIVLDEGLPYPTINGHWVKDPAAFAPDVLTSGVQYDSIISYTKQLGFPAIHAYDLRFIHPDRSNDGFLDLKRPTPFRMASGDLSTIEYSKLAAKEGLMLGRVCITNSLAPGTKDASPVPSDSLCIQFRRHLAADISPTDTVITVDDPTYMDEIGGWEGHCESLNIIKIGKELIHFLGISDTAPYRLKNVTRGYWGSEPASHKAGDNLDKIQVTVEYGYDGLIPNLVLQDEIARLYAHMAKNTGITLFDFDGQEFLFDQGHGYYSTKRFFREMFAEAKRLGIDYIRFSGATLSEGSWHYQSTWNIGGGTNMYDLNTREWGSTTSQGKDMRDVTYSNYFPVSFGNNFPIRENSTVAQYENIEALCVGFGATYFLNINQKEVEKCPQKTAIFNAIHTWEDARHANAFPLEVRKKLMDSKRDWTLERGSDNDTWNLYEIIDGKRTAPITLHRAAGY